MRASFPQLLAHVLTAYQNLDAVCLRNHGRLALPHQFQKFHIGFQGDV